MYSGSGGIANHSAPSPQAQRWHLPHLQSCYNIALDSLSPSGTFWCNPTRKMADFPFEYGISLPGAGKE